MISDGVEQALRRSLDDDDAWRIAATRDVAALAAAQVRRTRRRRREGVASVVGVLVLLVTGMIVGRSVTALSPASPPAATPSPPATTPSQTTTAPSVAHPLGIVRVGDLVTVQGTVYQASGRPPELCATLTILQSLPSSVNCNSSLVLSHVDRNRITAPTDAIAVPGVIGTATFTGIWHPGRLDVRTQIAARPSTSNRTFEQSLTHVPCPTPPGGWKPSSGGAISPHDMGGIDYYKAKHLTDVLSLAVFHPAGGTVIVLSVTDPAAAVKALAVRYAGRLCVVRSRWTKAQVDAVHDKVHRLGVADPAAGLSNGGTTVSADGQLAIGVAAIARDPSVDQLLRQAPPGLIDFTAFLQPAS